LEKQRAQSEIFRRLAAEAKMTHMEKGCRWLEGVIHVPAGSIGRLWKVLIGNSSGETHLRLASHSRVLPWFLTRFPHSSSPFLPVISTAFSSSFWSFLSLFRVEFFNLVDGSGDDSLFTLRDMEKALVFMVSHSLILKSFLSMILITTQYRSCCSVSG
jgi:hypothetical protein